ncbi:glycine zipper domain-containing protein [Sinorhizobium sp. BG8]|uniref:glycine zipper domain-containing protein n=1 Tax=Sinorhizobium sp. BG8 TaxID=2613773 RepID=UPI00193E8314|nr:glycine zipper domain-containing protein [Sinorhizobium sp. BG8]QRM54315.1 glycine zipper 2TM domain-containing protein [Sinorhizobium sp. BG8]
MKKNLLVATALIVSAVTVASCTPTERGATIGAASGAIIGGAVTGKAGGALAGAAIGGVGGALIGHASEPGRCVYRDRYGRRYTASC